MTPSVASLQFELLAFFAADHAESVGGKLYANGAFWTRWSFPMYPVVLPPLSLVAVLKVPFAEYHSEHTFVFGMVDQDGNAMPLRIEGNFRVGASPDMKYGDPTVMPIAASAAGVELQHPGDYAFTFALDDTPLERYSVRAVQLAVPMQFKFMPPSSE